MVRIVFVLTIFTSHSLTFFSIKLPFFVLSRDPRYRSRQMDFCPAAAATRSRVLQQSNHTKMMVRIHFVMMILQFVYSPFFQSNCYFRAISRSVISQPTAGFLPSRRRRPLACITTERQRKKNRENALHLDNFTVCLLTFFSI